MKLRDLIGSKPADIPVPDDVELARARRRVSRMSTHELLEWADQAGTGMAKAFADFRKEGSLASLDEISVALLALTAVTDELTARTEGP
jgi:hypothetical protein